MQTNSFMCLSPLAKPTFHWRYVVNHHLCRNLIQTLRSLYCDLGYFCFLKSHPLHRWLPGLPSPGCGRKVSRQGKDPVFIQNESLGASRCFSTGPRATGNVGERQQRVGHRWPCKLDGSFHVISGSPMPWEGQGSAHSTRASLGCWDWGLRGVLIQTLPLLKYVMLHNVPRLPEAHLPMWTNKLYHMLI